MTPVTFYLLPRPLTAPPEPPSGPPPPESAPSPCTLRGRHPSPWLLTGSFSEPPLWSSLCRTNDIHLLALIPELWDLQVQPHPRSDGLTPVPEAGSPWSPSADRAPQGPGHAPAEETHPLVLVRAEQPRVVSLLHHDEGDARLVILLQLDARLPDGQELVVEDLRAREVRLRLLGVHGLRPPERKPPNDIYHLTSISSEVSWLSWPAVGCAPLPFWAYFLIYVME